MKLKTYKNQILFITVLLMAGFVKSEEHLMLHNHLFAPIGVMGEHSHKKGMLMLSYFDSTMFMDGNRSGNTRVSSSDVLNDFMVAPEKMLMQMRMFSFMYAINDDLTLMGMVPYKRFSMEHINRAGIEFTTKSEGFGDFNFTGNYVVYRNKKSKILLMAGASLPTGSINKRDDMPTGANQKLPYPMQLGSGTYDLLPGITYTDRFEKWSWGTQLKATIRLGKNENEYRLGDEYFFTMWTVRKLTHRISTSLRLDAKTWDNIHGADSDLNSSLVPTSRSDLRGGKRVDLLVGVDISLPSVKIFKNRLAVEFGMPIYQNLDGPQLETDYRLTIAFQVMF